MPDPTPDVLHDVHAFLDSLAHQRASPEAALAGLPSLRARHPGADIDVVWEQQAFDGSTHFDALIRQDAGKTISVSVCQDHALPWPLRGLQRWKDSDLVRVNGVVLSVADAIAQLDVLWERVPLMQRLVDRCLVDEALAREPVDVSVEETQQALDAMRRGRGLLSVADLEAWMKDSGATWQMLEAMATQLARTAKLRERTVGDRVDEVLAHDLRSFDMIAIATAQARSEQTAAAVRDAALRGGRSLLEASQHVFAQGRDGEIETSLRRVRRHRLEAAVERAIAAAGGAGDTGLLVGPVPVGDGHLLAQVLAVEPAEPRDPELRRLVAARLFDEWLREQRRGAHIEWFWGSVEGTRNVAG
ncbi:TIGR04500 family putative peptide maturation system protein [Piscinibacter sp. XHJ-5]|uniref:TIGR04500 family putative peptide maturation system protein n=1 Tax=Piscinibacter sp. XHJ-5 TaxID=3037797 RepID=UPI002453636D|nr:TIGR04500 family putative peptide maturation system protein [Piscinibacter sp. XHJ-5]